MSRPAPTGVLPMPGEDLAGPPEPGRQNVGRVAAALARGEGRRLFRSPAFLTGAALTVFIQARVVLGILLKKVGQGDLTILWIITAIPLLLLLFVLTTVTAMRERRHDTEELFETAPVPASARTGALLLSAGWAILGAIVVVLPFRLITTAIDVPTWPQVLVTLELPLVVACVVALGVMLGRWVPFLPVGPVVAILLLGPIGAGLTADTRGQFFGLWLAGTDSLWAMGWHAVYLIGLIGLAAGLALLRHGIRRGPATFAALSLGIAITAGVLQLPDFCYLVSEGAKCVWR